MRRVLVVLLCMLSATQALAAAPSKEKFTRQFAAALNKAMPGGKIEIVEPLQLRSVDAQGTTMTFNLDNAYNDVVRDPGKIDTVIAAYVAGFTEPQDTDAPIDRASVVPVIKGRDWMEGLKRAQQGNESKPGGENVYDEMNEDLLIVYAEDTPRNTRYLMDGDLEKAGLKREHLRELAIDNLQHILPQVELHQGEHVSMLVAGADYVPSLLLIEPLWTNGDLKVDGEFVVAVPTRELLLFTGSKDSAGIAELQRIANEAVAESNYAVSSQLFVYRDGRFQRFKP